MLRLMQLQPQAFEDYINAWQDDLRVWAERLETVPRVGSVAEALERLALDSAQRGHATVHEPVGTVPALHVILDGAAFVVYIMASNLRYGRAASMFTRVRQWIQRTDPRGAIGSKPEAPNAEPELALAQDPALAAAPGQGPRQLPDVVGSTWDGRA